MNKALDFLAIGDITTDAFIRLKDAHVHCKIDRAGCELCVRFGDKIPYEFVEVVRAVGNSPNAAVAAARLGLASALATNLGDDENGNECIAALRRDGVDTSYAKVHTGSKTNYHYVLWYEADRTILVKHEEYPYSFPRVIPPPRFAYLSSIGGGTERYHDEIGEWLAENPDVKFAFQPGTFQINLGAKRLRALYERAEVFAVNTEEARKILGQNAPVKTLLDGVAALGPRIVLISDGPKGAYLKDGTGSYFMEPYPDPKPPYDRTGAGDAFAATFVSALALGKNSKEAMRWALVNPMSVVQYVGAQKGLLSRSALEGYLAKAPPDFQPRRL